LSGAFFVPAHGKAGHRDRSAKRESKQARAKQHKAGCGYREEAVGHEVMITHSVPAVPDAGPNLLKISKSAVWQKVLRREIRPSNESPQMRGREKCRRW
jgi:hypothetical protein